MAIYIVRDTVTRTPYIYCLIYPITTEVTVSANGTVRGYGVPGIAAYWLSGYGVILASYWFKDKRLVLCFFSGQTNGSARTVSSMAVRGEMISSENPSRRRASSFGYRGGWVDDWVDGWMDGWIHG